MNENDLRGRMTLDVEPFRKELVNVENAVNKTTSTIEKETEKAKKGFNAAAIGAVALNKALELTKKAVSESDLIKLAFDVDSLGSILDSAIIKFGRFAGILGKDDTEASFKAAGSLKALTEQIAEARKEVEKLEAGRGDSILFSAAARAASSLGIDVDVQKIDQILDKTIRTSIDKAKQKLAALEAQGALFDTGFGGTIGADLVSTILGLSPNNTQVNERLDQARQEVQLYLSSLNTGIKEAEENAKRLKAEFEATFGGSFKKTVEDAAESLATFKAVGEKTAQGLHGAFSEGFFDLFQTGFEDVKNSAQVAFDFIRAAVNRLVSDIIASQLLTLFSRLVPSGFSGVNQAPLDAGGVVDPTGFRPFGAGDFGGGVGVTSSAGRFGGISIGGGIAAAAAAPVAVSVTINAMDGADVERVLSRNRGLIVGLVDDANRRRPRQSGGGR